MNNMSPDYTELNISKSKYLGEHYHLELRGHGLNPMIDAATPLLGMVLRLKDISAQSMPENLYEQIVQDIKSLEYILREHNYEPGMMVSFRYVLCTFIDEIALAHGWGAKSSWFQQSLLTYFHNETWGGEKVYILLDKLIDEPKRYLDLLEFMYVCFGLSFRGRYKISESQNVEFEAIYKKLHDVIKLNNTRKKGSLIIYDDNDSRLEKYRLFSKMTIRKSLFFASIGLVCIYSFYALRLNNQSNTILEQLNSLLK